MEETVNQVIETVEGQEKTFTQSDVDRIVAERLSRERGKYADYETLKEKASKFDAAEEANKSELQKAQELAEEYKLKFETLSAETNARNIRDKVSTETGVPAFLLHGNTEDECKAEADAILKFKGDTPKYPSLKDSGEVQKISGGKTRDQFNDWFKDNF